MFRSLTLLAVFTVLLLGVLAANEMMPSVAMEIEPTSVAASLPSESETAKKLRTVAFEHGSVPIIVGVHAASVPEGGLDEGARDEQRRMIRDAQMSLLGRIGGSVSNIKQFESIPFIALEVDSESLESLLRDPDVKGVYEDSAVEPTLAESVPVVGAPLVWPNGYTGAGWAVAVLDTGVEKTHSFLTGKVISEGCYSTNSATFSSVCPGGVPSTTASGSGVPCSSSVNGCYHGTHVAGIATGTNASFSGVAKGANIVAMQVFSRSDDAATCGATPVPCILSMTSDQILAMERVLTLSSTTNIASVNMSLGGGQFTASCDAANAPMKAAIDNLRSVNIATVIATGNNGYTNAISSPACISTSVAVGSTGDGSGGATLDVVSSFSNSSPLVSLLAPGQLINSSMPGNTYGNLQGTSMATPHVAGAWAILRQRSPNASVSTILDALTTTGLPVTDTRNGVIKPRIRINNAINLEPDLTAIAVSDLSPDYAWSNGIDALSTTGITLDSSNNSYITGSMDGINQRGFVRKHDQNGNSVWGIQFESGANSNPTAIDSDPLGNIYVGGWVQGGALSGQTNLGMGDAFVRKYDSLGNVIWTRQFGTTTEDRAFSIATDIFGNVYVAGVTFGSLPGQTGSGGGDDFLRKYDSAGNILWTRQIQTNHSPSYEARIAVDSAGNVYLGGYGPVSSTAYRDYLRKYDVDGNVAWTRSDIVGYVSDVETDSNGNVLVTGLGSPFQDPTVFGQGTTFLRKYDSAGTVIWARYFGSGSAYPRLAVDGSGSSYVLADAVRKYDASGNAIWANNSGSTSLVYWGIDTDISGNAYVVSPIAGEGIMFRKYSGGTSSCRPWNLTINVVNRQGTTAAFSAGQRILLDDLPNSGFTYGVPAVGNFTGVTGTTNISTTMTGNSLTLTATGPVTIASGGRFTVNFSITPTGNGVYQNPRSGGTASVDPNNVIVESNENNNSFSDTEPVSGCPAPPSPTPTPTIPIQPDLTAVMSNGLPPDGWTRQFGTSGAESARAVASDSSGNTYVAGTTTGQFTGELNFNAFVRKYDASGNAIWTRQFPVTILGALCVDLAGNIYVAGAAGSDAFLRKYDQNGNVKWTRQFGSTGTDQGNGVAVDPVGYVYVAGYTDGTFPGQTLQGPSDAFIRKYDPSGNAIWTRQFGTGGNDNAYSVAVDSTGSPFVAGYTDGQIPNNVLDAYVRKFDSAGNTTWNREFGSSGNHDATGVAVDGAGNSYVVGNNLDSGTTIQFRKYDPVGNVVWSRLFSTAKANSVAVDAAGSSYVTGSASTLPGEPSFGGGDAFVRKYNSTGDILWTRQFGTSAADVAFGSTVDPNGIVSVVGYTGGTLPDQTSSGSNDAFVRKFAGGTTACNSWTWTVTTVNQGTFPGAFLQGNTILTHNLPAAGLTYGAPTVGNFNGVTGSGNISASIVGNSLQLTATGTVQISQGGSFTVAFNTTPIYNGAYLTSGVVDPGFVVGESNENNNFYNNLVTVTGCVTPNYQVTYNGNGNTGGTAPVDPNASYIAGTTVGVLGAGTLVKNGYEFNGWNTAANGTGIRYLPAESFIINSNTTLYAQWITAPIFSSGSLDSTFGSSGKITTDLGGNADEVAYAVVVQPDGKIILAGRTLVNTSNDFALVRYNANGSLDTTFDGDGKVTTPILAGDVARAIKLQSDGKIVAAGSSYNGTNWDFSMVRYNANGSLDTTFDSDGILTTAVLSGDDQAYSVAIQPDGKIVVAGYAFNGTNNDFAVVRYNTNGSLDTTFDGDGMATTPVLGFNDAAFSVAIQPDGKIVAAGSLNNGSNGDIALVRYNANGSLDTAFDGDGKVVTSIFSANEEAWAVALQPDGKIVVSGYSNNGTDDDVALVRYNPNGTLDNTFDGDGKVTTPVLSGRDWANAIAIKPDGRIVTAGFSNNGTNDDFNVVLYKADGSLDTSFDGDGKTTTPILNGNEYANGVAVQPDGRIIAAGYSHNGSNYDFALVRYGVNSGAVPRRTPFDFDGDGKTDLSIFRPNGAASEWWWLKSSTGGNAALQFGASTDRIVPSDYTGDGKTDVAFWRPSTGQWFVLRSEDFSFYAFPFGATGDVPVPADYDGDGKADAAVFRASAATWYINKSSGGTDIIGFGAANDLPVNADYDGDGKADVAIYRPNGPGGAEWWVRRSSNASVFALQFGTSTDKAVPGDFTGDGKADVAFWRPSTGFWNILRSEDFSYYAFPFGANGDVASPGDYDGDGKLDAAVFRPSNATWYANRSTAGTLIQQFGATGDVPVPSAFVR